MTRLRCDLGLALPPETLKDTALPLKNSHGLEGARCCVSQQELLVRPCPEAYCPYLLSTGLESASTTPEQFSNRTFTGFPLPLTLKYVFITKLQKRWLLRNKNKLTQFHHSKIRIYLVLIFWVKRILYKNRIRLHMLLHKLLNSSCHQHKLFPFDVSKPQQKRSSLYHLTFSIH